MTASPIAFFVLVPEKIIHKIFELPWTTILAVGGPAIAASVGVIRQAFQSPITKPVPKTQEQPPPLE